MSDWGIIIGLVGIYWAITKVVEAIAAEGASIRREVRELNDEVGKVNEALKDIKWEQL